MGDARAIVKPNSINSIEDKEIVPTGACFAAHMGVETEGPVPASPGANVEESRGGTVPRKNKAEVAQAAPNARHLGLSWKRVLS